MCGLPGENDDDLRAILDLAPQGVAARARRGQPRLPHHGQRLAARAQAAHAVRVGRAGLDRRAEPAARACCARRRAASRSRSSTATPRPRCSRACSRAATAGWAPRSRRRTGAAAASTPGREHLRYAHLARRVPRPRHRSRALAAASAPPSSTSRGTSCSRRSPRSSWSARSCAPTRPAITDDCRLEDICFSCGVVECPQRPWVKQPHAPLDLARGARPRRRRGFGRRARASAHAGARARPPRRGAAGVATSTRFRIRVREGARDALHLAPRSHAHLGAGACAAPGCRWRSPRGITRT